MKYYICEDCAKDANLKRYINKKGSINVCSICEKSNISVDIEGDSKIQELFKALMKYYYAEYEYNPHLGGAETEEILKGDNPILKLEFVEHDLYYYDDNEYYFEDVLIDVLFGKVYENYDEGVSLYAGFGGEGIRLMFPCSIKESFSTTISDIEEKLQKQNYYIVEEECLKILERYRNYFEKDYKVNSSFWRARIGVGKKLVNRDMMLEDKYYDNLVFEPYYDIQIGAPPISEVGEGRLNRKNISYLYLASDIDAAIAEIRPHPNHLISVGEFILNRNLRIADFAQVDFLDFFESDKLLDMYVFFKSLSNRFSLPVIPEERNKYMLTQCLTEALRKMGFDGITFTSSLVENQYNLVLFNSTDANYVQGSGQVYKIEHLMYEKSKLNFQRNEGKEYKELNDSRYSFE